MITIRSQKDLIAGLIMLVFGLAFLWVGQRYQMGTARQMGPGYFPIVLSVILSLLGIAICIRSTIVEGEPFRDFNLKGIAIVTAATCLFGFLIRPAGLALAVFAVVMVGAMASSEFRLKPILLLALGMSLFCVVVFIKALGLPMPMFGYWFD